MHHPHPSQQGLPPPQQQHIQHSRPGVIPHHPDSPHQPQQQHPSSGPYPSPQIPSHSLPQQHPSQYVGALSGTTGQQQPEVPYYQQPYNSSSTAVTYSSADQMAAAGTIRSYPPPPLYQHPSQSASPASVQSPHHDQHGRQMYQPPQIYNYPAYQVAQQSPYTQHPPPQQSPMGTGYMAQQQNQQLQQHASHPVTPGMTGSPGAKMPPNQMQRQGPGMSPPSGTPTGPPGSASSLHHGASGSSVNPNAAPGPIPATTPLVVRQDQNGVQWIAFEYSRDRVKMEYTIRCDVESVDVNNLPQDFKTENCVYPRACCPKDQYKGNRLHYESECNTVGWALAQLNPTLRGKRGLIQRAVDSWRNSNQDPRLRSRRVRRMAKINNRKANAVQHSAHLGGPGGPGAAPGLPATATGLSAAGPRQPGMSVGGSGPGLLHHHEQPGGAPPGADDVSAGNEYNEGSHTHHHQAPNGNTASDVRTAHNFYPQYPTSQTMVSSSVPSTDGMHHVSSHAPSHADAITTASRQEEERNNVALFGDLPEAKRRKFILVDDPQRGTRVRVRVMLDQVRMHEMPDSYRKNNSVYPRSWFATEMQSPPPSPRRGRWPEDFDPEDNAGSMAKTFVPVPMVDGSEAKVPLPRMTRAKRNKEVTLNDLGYRMSWSQSRVFSGRTLFLQRSLDAYRNKMRSTMVAAGQDVATVAPHFETRVGKRKWLERSKKSRREASP